jgi:hypothetical protein
MVTKGSDVRGSEAIRQWPQDQRDVAEEIIKEYGEPDEATPTRLIWLNRKRWKEIIVSKEGNQHNFPFPHLDIVESITEYQVPADKCSNLEEFDGSVTVRRTQGFISARCHDEQANLLAINLANDIITGKQTVNGAREAYVDAMIDFRAKGSTPYMSELQFPPPKKAADPDISVTTTEELQKRSQKVRVERRP